MNTEQMRQALLYAYPGPKWLRKVNRMSDSQVQAVYFRMKSQGKI